MNTNSSENSRDWASASDPGDTDQVAAYDAMRRRCPVAYSESHGWSVFRHADVRRILHDHETYSNLVSRHISVPNGMDPPEHATYRQIIEPYFNHDRMDAFEPTCRIVASELVVKNIHRGCAVEAMGALAKPFAARIQCAFLGWPLSLHETLVRWVDAHHDATRRADREVLAALACELDLLIEKQLRQRRDSKSKADSDLTAALMHERVDGRKLNNQEISSILRNWTVGEVGTISASIGILIHHLAVHPEHQTALRRDSSLLPAAIDEILRVHNPLHGNRRVTTCPVKLDKHSIAAGERIYLNWISANRDESVFEDAGTVKFDRDPKDNLLYGAGIHVCPGAPLARMEMRVFLQELFAHTQSFRFQPQATVVPATDPESGYASIPIHLQIET
ncbi:cytochrome P450 [Aureliella helgolandensis]|uniref:Erythromycin C-12 hydroxylase n=1 Tax=Aureliella helgolandensis TaxID=2527968 RepID=A0A518G7R4_9BACT|nr:cytochrome P450 [Aureliella helgolandensis]QDV24612.1 Erythromycin C-12 hydroxylase [Aureliella helgolandensis]